MVTPLERIRQRMAQTNPSLARLAANVASDTAKKAQDKKTTQSSNSGTAQPTTQTQTVGNTGLTQDQLDNAKQKLTGNGLNNQEIVANVNVPGPSIKVSQDVMKQNASPSFNRPSQTATPTVLSTEVSFQPKGIITQSGTPQPPSQPYVGDPNAAKHRVDVRLQNEVVNNLQTSSNVVSQNTYNNLVNNDFRVIGINKDANGVPQITNAEQIGALKAAGYTVTNNPDGTMSIVPPKSYEQQAVDSGNKYFTEQINNLNTQQSIQNIETQEYGKENYVTVTNADGTVSVVPRPAYEQQQFQSERAGIVGRMTGQQGGIGSLEEFARFWYSGFTPENLLYTQTIGEVLFGGKDKTQNVIDDYTKSVMSTNAMIKGLGPAGAFIKSYEPGGFGFTGTLAALFQVGGPALGAVGNAGKGGAIIAKTLPFVAMGGFAAVSGADIGYTFAKEPRPGAGLTKSLQVGAQFAMLYGFGKIAEGPKTEVTMYGQGEKVQGVKIQNYYDIMGLKVKSGKPIVGVRTGVEPDITTYGTGTQGWLLSAPKEPVIRSVTNIQPGDIFRVGIEPIPIKESLTIYQSKIPTVPIFNLQIQDLYDITGYKPQSTEPLTFFKGGKSSIKVKTGFEPDYFSYQGIPLQNKIEPYSKKEIVPNKQPGKLALPFIVSPVIQEMFPNLESGVPKYLEGMLFLKPKVRTIKQIVKPERQVKADDIFSSVSGGSQQVVLERPVLETKTIQKPVMKTIQAKNYLESMLQQKVETGSIFSPNQKLSISFENEYVQRALQSEQISKPIMKTERGVLVGPMIATGTKQGSISIEKAIQSFSFKQGKVSVPNVMTMQDIMPDVVSISDTGKISIQAKAQAKISASASLSDQLSIKDTVVSSVFGLDLGSLGVGKSGQQNTMLSGEQGFNVQVKDRIYSHGKRISKDNYHNITKQPLSYEDALSVGADTVGKNEKASFRVVPADGQAHRLNRSVTPFSSVAFQYNRKDNNTWTEKPAYRINSPGEVMAITMKGIQANRRR